MAQAKTSLRRQGTAHERAFVASREKKKNRKLPSRKIVGLMAPRFRPYLLRWPNDPAQAPPTNGRGLSYDALLRSLWSRWLCSNLNIIHKAGWRWNGVAVFAQPLQMKLDYFTNG